MFRFFMLLLAVIPISASMVGPASAGTVKIAAIEYCPIGSSLGDKLYCDVVVEIADIRAFLRSLPITF